ncbi:hypothetical protein BGZ97_006693 [Linnemannia gamsii]|uniref:PPPDE domain-containing protein n=1 Tax=Linnemannia gamsii TaxID=64522 RepID=A0A9P6QNR4_9FUNG|nr:hypothetical protein BGZ97_006693 [Linnemannia gamsii]
MERQIQDYLNKAPSDVSRGKVYILYKRLRAFDKFRGKGDSKSLRKFKHWMLVIVFDSKDKTEPDADNTMLVPDTMKREFETSDPESNTIKSDSDSVEPTFDTMRSDSDTIKSESNPIKSYSSSFMLDSDNDNNNDSGISSDNDDIDSDSDTGTIKIKFDYIEASFPTGFMIDFGEEGDDTGKGMVLLSRYNESVGPPLRYFLANITISPETLISQIQDMFDEWTEYSLTHCNCQHFAQHVLSHFDQYLSDKEPYILKVSKKIGLTFAGCLGYIFSSRVSKCHEE